MIQKLLIANRGEIACRIIKTAKSLGIKTLAVFSDIDEGARFVRLADEIAALDGIDAVDTYLNIGKIIKIAKDFGVDAIHPGYGFLSENAEFARECEKNNIIFVGAQADAIEAMGLKDSAKKIANDAGVPILKGFMGENQNEDFLSSKAEEIGFPLLIKAIAGGGGRGIRQVNEIGEFKSALLSAKREAKSAFNDDRMMLEKLVQKPRHIEVQVFGDKHGNVVHLFERDCSVQRRRQKLIEEAPAPNLPEDVRNAMFDAAVKLAKSVKYQGAGTIEFIVDGNGTPRLDGFWFLEMNTRLQVEHPVTEEITDLDLVEWQLRIAAGEKLPLGQNEITCNGHAIEARIVAEDTNNNFMPSSGIYYRDDIYFHGLRIDEGFENGDYIPSNYDSLVEKIICWGYSRESAIDDLKSRLEVANYDGFANNGGFVKRILSNTDFENANLYTAIIDDNIDSLARKPINDFEISSLAAIIRCLNDGQKNNNSFNDFAGFRVNSKSGTMVKFQTNDEVLSINIFDEGAYISAKSETREIIFHKADFDLLSGVYQNDNQFENRHIYFKANNDKVSVFVDGERYDYLEPVFNHNQASTAHSDEIVVNLPGKIVAINNNIGDKVTKGQIIVVIEAMKMEHSLKAMMDGEIKELSAKLNAQVKLGEILVKLV